MANSSPGEVCDEREVTVTSGGSSSGAEWKWSFLRAAELLLLPSHCESTGYAAIEALACGVPVLISNKVNTYRELQEDDCALVGDDTVQGIAQSVRSWLDLPDDVKRRMSANARRCFVARYHIDPAAKRFLDWLSRTRRRWALILDDVTSAADLEGLWPRGASGQVVVTTRLPQVELARPDRPWLRRRF